MTALAEALLTAQRGALAAMQKAYLRGGASGVDYDAAALIADLENIGCADVSDRHLFIAALDVMRLLGAEAPKLELGKTYGKTETASEAQMALLKRMADERGTVAPDYVLTKENASKIIDQLKIGTYNPDEWTVPF